MEIVYDEQDLRRYFAEAVSVSNESPVLLDRFLDDATELDVDAICDGVDVVIGGIMEHIEQAGIHSGDSGCSLPPYTLSKKPFRTRSASRCASWRWSSAWYRPDERAVRGQGQ